jgi:hypothetical protein
LGEDRPARSIPRDWREIIPDEDSQDEDVYSLDSNDSLDPDFDMDLDDQDVDDSQIDQWPDDWR